jgi:hypothetical protein
MRVHITQQLKVGCAIQRDEHSGVKGARGIKNIQ